MKKEYQLIQEMVEEIKNAKSPDVYLGNDSLVMFQIFLYGFVHALNEISGNINLSNKSFNMYVEMYFNSSVISGWSDNLLQHTKGKTEAFQLFYEVFDKYIKEIKEYDSQMAFEILFSRKELVEETYLGGYTRKLNSEEYLMRNKYQLLQSIVRQVRDSVSPMLYFGRESLEMFQTFLYGFECAEVKELGEKTGHEFSKKFTLYVKDCFDDFVKESK